MAEIEVIREKAEELGFFKTDKSPKPALSKEQRTILIRKGNELFNRGDYSTAKRIFITTRYTDGLLRMGDYYFARKEPLEAYKMYQLAPAPDKAEMLAQRMALIIRNWLKERN